MKKYEVKQKHINENLLSSFSILINAQFTSTTFVNKSIFAKNETQSATKSIKKNKIVLKKIKIKSLKLKSMI